MKQNIYDNKFFSEEYDKMRNENKGTSANDAIEIPIFRSLLPNLKDKSILDLGCGYGENDLYLKNKGASYVLGTDISNHMIEIADRDNKVDGIDLLNNDKTYLSEVQYKLMIDILDTINANRKDAIEKLIMFSNKIPVIKYYDELKEYLSENRDRYNPSNLADFVFEQLQNSNNVEVKSIVWVSWNYWVLTKSIK